MLKVALTVYIVTLVTRCSGQALTNAQKKACLFENCTSEPNESCPPGFAGEPCKCEASQYNGIYKCDSTRAYVLRGYWVGKCSDGSICTGNCPLGFCTYNDTFNQALPKNEDELEEYICGSRRQGVLCGECRPNYSVSYHSYTYKCTPNTLCNLGILFYLISELIPLTIMFVIVMVSNVSFTCGALNGFILFTQLQDSLAVHGNGVVRQIPSEQTFVIALYRLIYRFFNLEFFSIEKMSFCLWRNAKVLDAMAFKYVTIVYALILVLICIFVMSQSKMRKLFKCLRPKSLRSATIHGLTTFFVMCYSQCARVSIQILGPMQLFKRGPEFAETVVFRSGHLEIFELQHLKYAIPAILFVCFMLIPPPLILILYPLSYKILALCKLSEAKPVNCISKYIPIQLLDSFQSCFKDEFRFFAGLYFLYRLATLIAFVACRNLTEFYTVLELLLIIALAFQSLAQPYKERWHNVVDSLLLANLAIINGISLYHFISVVEGTDSNVEIDSKHFTVVLQLILLYLPLVVIAVAICLKIYKKVKNHHVAKNLLQSIERSLKSTKKVTEEDLPPLRDEDSEPSYKRLIEDQP